MAKGLRSKYRRRIRTVRREHYWEVEGKAKLENISKKLQDPLYDFRQDVELPANAFLEPNNPSAVFPQNKKPHIIDFRDHKMAGSGFASKGNFRKKMSTRTIKAKYESYGMSIEEIEEEKQAENESKEAAVIAKKILREQDKDDNEMDMD